MPPPPRSPPSILSSADAACTLQTAGNTGRTSPVITDSPGKNNLAEESSPEGTVLPTITSSPTLETESSHAGEVLPERPIIPEKTKNLHETPGEVTFSTVPRTGTSPTRAVSSATRSLPTKIPALRITPLRTLPRITFCGLSNGSGITTAEPRRGARASLSPSFWDAQEEDMDAELPVPEHLSCLYDVVKAVKNSNENLSEQEIENKFTQLSLAFKTDRLTLRQRLDLQQRHRDTAEVNLEAEMKHLRNAVLALHADCSDSELVDAVTQVRRHLDVLAASSTRLVSTSEVWGAVQQEWRVSRALEVLFLHADNVKRKYEREHGELEELRRLMNEYQIELPGSQAVGGGSGNQLSSDSPSTSRRLRALSLAVCSNKAASSQEARRVSLASSSKNSSGFAGSARSRGRRASLMPDLKPFREHLAAVAAAAVAASKDSSSSSSSSNGNDLNASKDCGEDGSKGIVPPTGRWNCSITEEASESGDEEGSSTQDASSATIMTATSNTNLSSSPSSCSFTNVDVSLRHLPADLLGLDPNPDDSDERASDDPSQSDMSQGSSGDYREPPPASFWTRSRPQHWLVVALKEVVEWAKGGQWPYSQQQTVQGARYAFTSLLLVLAALFLLVTLSSGDVRTPQPRHPGWTTVHHILHPFVSLRYLALPPT